jgi:hypothetical protein
MVVLGIDGSRNNTDTGIVLFCEVSQKGISATNFVAPATNTAYFLTILELSPKVVFF